MADATTIVAGGGLHSLFNRFGAFWTIASVVAFAIAIVAGDIGVGSGVAAIPIAGATSLGWWRLYVDAIIGRPNHSVFIYHTFYILYIQTVLLFTVQCSF